MLGSQSSCGGSKSVMTYLSIGFVLLLSFIMYLHRILIKLESRIDTFHKYRADQEHKIHVEMAAIKNGFNIKFENLSKELGVNNSPLPIMDQIYQRAYREDLESFQKELNALQNVVEIVRSDVANQHTALCSEIEHLKKEIGKRPINRETTNLWQEHEVTRDKWCEVSHAVHSLQDRHAALFEDVHQFLAKKPKTKKRRKK